MRRLIYSLSLITTLLPVISHAQDEPTPLSLDDAIKYAIRHNYTLKNARLDVGIQQAQNAQVTASAYPKINGKGEFDDFINPQTSFIPGEFFGGPAGSFYPVTFTPKFANSAGISGSQVLFDGSLLVALKARKAVMELAERKADVTDATVRYNVIKAYNSLVIAYRQFYILESSLQYARSIQHDIAVTRQAGFAEKIDVERVDVQVNNLASDSLRIANVLTVSEQMLKYNMGMNLDKPIVLTDTNIDEHRSHIMELLNEDADYNRVPEYNLSLSALKLNEYNVRRYKLAALPSLAAFGNVGYNYSSNDFYRLFQDRYAFSSLVGLQLTVPIFNGFLRVNQLKEAKLNVLKSKNDIANAKLGIDFQANTARTTLKNNLLQAESQKRNLALANDVLDLAQKKYKAGVGSNMEVTQAQTDQLRAQTNYFSAELDVINAEADLQKALGLLK